MKMSEKNVIGWLSGNWIGIFAIVLMVVTSAGYFVTGGIWIATNSRNWVNAALPAATVIGVIFLVRKYFKMITQKKEDWQYGIFFPITFGVMLIIGFTAGTSNETYANIYDIFVNGGQSGIVAMTGFAFASLVFRTLYFKNVKSSLMAILFILALMALTPLGEFIPILKDTGNWLILYLGTPAEQGQWMAMYGAWLVIFVRILFFREKLSVKTQE
jgi:hypothetical protein